jgi:hypothetical protein
MKEDSNDADAVNLSSSPLDLGITNQTKTQQSMQTIQN